MGEGNAVATIQGRSQWVMSVVQQLFLALKETLFRSVSDRFRAFLVCTHAHTLTSVPAEDAFNRQKKLKIMRSSNRRLASAKCWGIVLEKKVMSGVHKYEEAPDVCMADPSPRWMPESTFKVDRTTTDESKRLYEMTSMQQKTSWYSPAPECWGQRFADQALLNEAYDRKNWCELDRLWLSSVIKVKHNIIARYIKGDGGRGMARAVTVPMRGSTAFCWPLMEDTQASPAGDVWRLGGKADLDDLVAPIYCLDHWEFRCVRWRSPAWQWVHCVRSRNCWPIAIRAFAVEGEVWESFPRLAARHAYWSLPLSTVIAFCALVGLILPRGIALFDAIFQGISHTLQLEPLAVFDLMTRRVGYLDTQYSECVDALLDLDLESGHFCPSDVEQLQASRERSKARMAERTGFLQEFVRRKREHVRQGHLLALRGELRSRQWEPISSGPTQAEAKRLLPPALRLYIWKANASQAWAWHYEPYGYRTFKWMKYGGSSQALKAALTEAWTLWLGVEGLKAEDCPIPGIAIPRTGVFAP